MKVTHKNQSSSTSTMRYLTMIVALAPSVAAFSGLPNMPIATVGYSDLGSISTCAPRSERRMCTSSPTRLHYISGASSEHTVTSTPGKEGSTWWTSIFGREQSSAADQYLEFLDKRYNHFLKDDEVKTESKGFNVMNWLYQGTNYELGSTRKDDALFVLGVSKLASKKFLQRHHLPASEDTTEQSKTVAGATDAEIVRSQATPVPFAAVLAVFHEVALRRQRFVERQDMSLRLAMASVVSSPIRAANGLRKLFVMGGGKKSLAMTFAALAALSLLLRPILSVAAASGANTMTP